MESTKMNKVHVAEMLDGNKETEKCINYLARHLKTSDSDANNSDNMDGGLLDCCVV
jgi:hypothetical protein